MNGTDPIEGPTPVFDEAQCATLLAALRIHPGGEATVEEVEQLFDWAQRVSSEGICLDLVLLGMIVVVGFKEGHPRFAARIHADARDVAAEAERLLDGGQR